MYSCAVLGGSKENSRLGHRVALSCALAHLARQNSILCCFENTLLAVMAKIIININRLPQRNLQGCISRAIGIAVISY